MEEWRDIPGWEGYYEASNLGRVRSLDRIVFTKRGWKMRCRGQLLKQGKDKAGYMRVAFPKNGGGQEKMYVHRLVLSAFKGEPEEGMCTRHLDGDRTNNSPGNLEWGTYSENNYDIVRHGTHNNGGSTECFRGHPREPFNITAYHAKRGWRACRACGSAVSYLKHHPELEISVQGLSDMYYEQYRRSHFDTDAHV